MALLACQDDASTKYAKVDDSLHDELAAFAWRVRHNSSGDQYAARWVKTYRKWSYLHVEVYTRKHGPVPSGFQVDHADNDTFNCESSNLRLVTPSQNAANRRRRKPRGTKNPYRGVRVVSGRYQARIRVQRKLIVIGTFDDADEAARAYDAEATKHFGACARTNF